MRRQSLDDLAHRKGRKQPHRSRSGKTGGGIECDLPSLFDSPGADEVAKCPIAKRQDQAQWRDPATGYVRRNVSPADALHPIQIVEILFPPGERIAFETNGRETMVCQQIWVLEGRIEVTADGALHDLHEGDCMAMCLDGPVMFHNPTRNVCRYALVISSEVQPKGRR